VETVGEAARRLLEKLDARIAERKAAGRLQGPAEIAGRDGTADDKRARPAPDASDDAATKDRAARTAPSVLRFPLRPALGAHAGAAVPRMPQGRPSFQARRRASNDNRRAHARHQVSRRVRQGE